MQLRVSRTFWQRASASALALSILVSTAPAHAWNNREHERLPDQAYQVLNLLRRGPHVAEQIKKHMPPGPTTPVPLTTRPASVPASEDATWNRFIAEATATADRLDNLLVDLSDSKRSPQDCGNLLPRLATGTHLADCRAGELSFPPSRSWGEGDQRCYLRRGYNFGDSNNPEVYQDVPTPMTGALLGYYAQAVDDEVNDTHMTERFTNAAGATIIKDITEKAGEIGIMLLVAPLVCFVDLLSFGIPNPCLDQAEQFSHDVEPIQRIDSILPVSIGDWDGDDWMSTTGLWHYITPDREGRFNDLPGMAYDEGGPNGDIDALDLGIIAGADLAGLTIDPDKSLGVSRYGQYANGGLKRNTPDWISHALGHIEFEPLDNLALYGWRNFQARKGASGLGWPLHAIGDAVQPHHTISATGWGHRPWEDFAGTVWAEMFNNTDPNEYLHYYDLPGVLEQAYRWWKFFEASNPAAGDLPVRDFITALATETRHSPGAVYPIIFKRRLGTDYTADETREIYGGNEPFAKDLFTRGMGATLAFLVKASLSVPVPTGTSPCACAGGAARLGLDAGGGTTSIDVCTTCGQGAFVSLPVALNGTCVAACPADKPFGLNGACLATCPAGSTCTGFSCPAATPFIESGSCVASCSTGTPLVVNRRFCQAACPAGQTAGTDGFCRPTPTTPACPLVGNANFDACCTASLKPCTSNDQCCSLSCSQDGICRGRVGGACATDGDCLSGICSQGACAAGSSACIHNDDCANMSCQRPDPLKPGKCRTTVGQGCGTADDCVSGHCELQDRMFQKNCCLGDGETCGSNGLCCSGFCSDTCQPRQN